MEIDAIDVLNQLSGGNDEWYNVRKSWYDSKSCYEFLSPCLKIISRATTFV